MSDSTPAFVGLSLGDSSENPKLPSTFNGTCNIFGSPSPLPLPPTHPANDPAQTSVFGSGGGNVATGFGAFGGLRETFAEWDESARGMPQLVVISFRGSFGVSGNIGNTTNSVSGACSAQPTKPSAFASNGEQDIPGSGFGQPLRLWDNSRSENRKSTHLLIFCGFSAFSQSPTSFMSAASLSPVSKSNAGGDGSASFAGTPSTLASAASSGKSAFGGGPSHFGQSENETPSPFGSQSPSGGAFSNFTSNGPSAVERPSAGGAFGALKSVSSSVFGQPAPSTSQVAFRDRESVPSTQKEYPTSLRKSEPGSPTISYSPDPDIPDSDIVIPSTFKQTFVARTSWAYTERQPPAVRSSVLFSYRKHSC
ncbi:hypothetical protein F5877DRAFT_85448 [Lentinula edodes]|nr:hypothetical protein F5877DRAFT_85448 [Lentinula edodes]